MSTLSSVTRRGTRAAQPVATAVSAGTLYFVTDENLVERSTGAAWEGYGTGVPTISAASKLLGRGAGGGAGVAQEITLGTGLVMTGTTLAAAGGGGGLVLLEQYTAAASAALAFTAFSATYDLYLLELLNLVPGTGAVDLGFRMSTDGGATYDSTNLYTSAIHVWNDGATVATGQAPAAPTSRMLVRNTAEINTDATYGVCGTLKIFSPGSAVVHKRVHGEYSFMAGTGTRVLQAITAVHAYRSATAVNGLQVAFTSGTIASGIARMYGIAKT